jgi:hypothetical protein
MVTRIHLYTVAPNGNAMTCHLCGYTHFHPADIEQRYCGHCRIFLTDVDDATQRAIKLGVLQDEPATRLAFLRRIVCRLRGIGRVWSEKETQ